jgi:dTDP-4-dehydrorhamnose reductase
MMRLLVTGAAGQLGGAIATRLSTIGAVSPMTHRDLDITREADVRRAVRNESPHVIINCSAYNAVDEAEHEAALALEANALGVLALARAARESGAVLVHYSSDFVFDGNVDRPYTETDCPLPQSNYGLSKLLGEWFAADAP